MIHEMGCLRMNKTKVGVWGQHAEKHMKVQRTVLFVKYFLVFLPND
jgi:hypothetical protein